MLGFAGDLLLDGVAGAQRHGDELADHAFLDAIAVEPGLRGHDHIVLRIFGEALRRGLAVDGVDLAGRYLHREWIVSTTKAYPQRLRLEHRQHHAAAWPPVFRYARAEVVDMTKREVAQSRGKRIGPLVIGDA